MDKEIDIQEAIEATIEDEIFIGYWNDLVNQCAVYNVPMKSLCAAFFFLGTYESMSGYLYKENQ